MQPLDLDQEHEIIDMQEQNRDIWEAIFYRNIDDTFENTVFDAVLL